MPLPMTRSRVALVRAIVTLVVACVVAACGPDIPPASSVAPSTGPTGVSTTLPPATPTSSVTGAPAPALNGERITFENGDLTLGGMLWKPVGNGPFKAVLWNHGSEKAPGLDGSNPLLGPVFAEAGYVFFMPMRRGQGTSDGAWIVDATNAAEPADRPALLALLHATEQLSDQLAGLAYLRGLSYVDGARVAVAGWSYGGIQTVLGAGDVAAGYLAAVAFTPASQSWDGNADLQAAMKAAATRAKIPFLFIQAENDYSLVPTAQLTEAIETSDGIVTRSIYAAFGTTAQDGHEFAVRGSELWTYEVLIFLANAFGE